MFANAAMKSFLSFDTQCSKLEIDLLWFLKISIYEIAQSRKWEYNGWAQSDKKRINPVSKQGIFR